MKRQTVILWHGLVILALSSFGAKPANTNYLQSELDHFSGLTCAQPSFQTIETEAVVLAVVSDDEVYVNKGRVARKGVITEVDKLLQLLPEEKRIIYIKAMPEVSFGTIVGIIEEARSRGYGRIGLAENKTRGQRESTIASVPETNDQSKSVNTQAPGQQEEQLTVTVETIREGRLSVKVNKISITHRKIADTIRAHLKGRLNTTVMIVAPAKLQYGSIVSVIDEVKKGGAEMVGLSVKQQ